MTAASATTTRTSRNMDAVFRALADPTRRHVLERLSGSPASATTLAAPFKMALPSFVEHLKVLESCGLVASHKEGRIRTYQLVPERLKAAEDWLSKQRLLWERRLDQLDAYLLEIKETKRS